MPFFIVFSFIVISVLLLRNWQQSALFDTKQGKELRYSPFHKTYSLLWFLIGNGITAYLLIVEQRQDIWFVLIFPVIINTFCLPLLLEFWFVKLVIKDQNVTLHSPWRKNRTIPLNDIITAEFDGVLRWHRFTTQSQGNIYLHNGISGKDEFLAGFDFFKEGQQ